MTNISELSLQRPTWAEINLDTLRSNYLKVQEAAPHSQILAVVKSDAYGHGAVVIALELQQSGVKFFGTATAIEAIQLRRAGIDGTLILLSGMAPAQIPLLSEYNLVSAVYSQEFLNVLSAYAVGKRMELPIHLKVDTGMGRLGFSVAEAAAILKAPPANIRIGGVFTHFANADHPEDGSTRDQLNRFLEFIQRENVSVPYIHAANSAAILNFPNTHRDLIRPGLLLYGISPLEKDPLGLQPILSLKSKIVQIRKMAKGERIGYGWTFCAEKNSLIATIPIGYADGLRRTLSNRLKVEIQGTLCPIAGTISMDLCMVDVTEIAERVKLYDEAAFIGPRVTAWDWAKLLDTIPYEITCLIGARVPRVYYKGGQIYDVYYP